MKTLILNIVVILFALGYTSSLAQDTPCNCCTKEHEAFDFWIGSWEVTTPDGNPAGTNKITKVEGNCIIRENWISAKSGYTGSSTNFYNSETKQWEQLWIDNAGAHLKLKGNRKGNQMILISDSFKIENGEERYNRITWTKNEDGTVRQLWEVMENENVASIAFDGLYKKVE